MELTTQPEAPLNVLVVDDIEAARTELADLVASLGHRCIQAGSGLEALERIDSAPIDIVLLDLLMPGLDGFEITREIRVRITGRWLPVFVVSSLEGDEHFVRAMAMGAADYLVKPVRPAILRAKLRHYQRVLALQSKTAMLAQRQRAINEHILDAVITIDGSARVCELNRAARQLFADCASGELVGKHIEELMGMTLAQLPLTAEFVHQRTGQPNATFAVSVSEWSMGAQSYCTIALHDLSESRRLERMKDEFLATVSHELRTPLTSILGAMGLLVAGAAGPLAPAALELASVAQRNGGRLSRLIDDLLDLTKLEGNRMPLNLREASLSPLLAEAISANTGYADRHGVLLYLQAPPQDARAAVDADRFLQVMANLLSNAIKHSPRGAAVEVRLGAVPSGWRIDVADQGPGISPEFRARLFEKFSQADGSDQRTVAGTGLGLYISRMLVDRMGGQIAAQSESGKGSVFSVSLPRPMASASRPWILCIARDRQELDRLAAWLADLAKIELVADFEAAIELVQHVGAPSALVANPQSQGLADEFCQNLARIAPVTRTLLLSDSVDQHFALRHALEWLPLSDVPRNALRARIQMLINRPLNGATHG